MLGNFTLGAVHFSWSLVRSWHSSIPNVTQKKPPITVTTSILTDFPDCSSKVPKFNFTSSKSIFYRSLHRIAWPKLISIPQPPPLALPSPRRHGAKPPGAGNRCVSQWLPSPRGSHKKSGWILDGKMRFLYILMGFMLWSNMAILNHIRSCSWYGNIYNYITVIYSKWKVR